MVDFETAASLAAQAFEGLFPFDIGGPFGGCVSWREHSVLVLVAFLYNCADFLLEPMR